MSEKIPEWKTAKNGAQYWCWLTSSSKDDVRILSKLLAATFFKTKNKLTLRLKMSFWDGEKATVKEFNHMTFYLRKGKTLEVYIRQYRLGTNPGYNPPMYNINKAKFKNVTNEVGAHLSGTAHGLFKKCITSNKRISLFKGYRVSDRSTTTLFNSYVEAALRSMLEDAGRKFIMSDHYDAEDRLAGAITEFRAPIIGVLREDWARSVKAGLHEPKNVILSIHMKSISSVVMKELARSKDLKDVVNRFLGNRGKSSTKILVNNLFCYSSVYTSKEGLRNYRLTGKFNSKEGDGVREDEDDCVVKMAAVNESFLELMLVLKRVLTVDHLNSYASYITSDNFPGPIGTLQANLRVILNNEDMYYPRPVVYDKAIENNRYAFKDYRKSLKKFKKDRLAVIKNVAEFLKVMGDSRKIHDLIKADSMPFLNDTYGQWYMTNGKIQMPEKVRSLSELHDYVSKEYRKLVSKDYGLGLMDVEWVSKLHKLEYSDIKTKHHFMIYVPQTNYDLVDWGQAMNNCIGGYGSKVKSSKGREVLLAIYKNGQLTYNLEITDKKVQQFWGKRNTPADKDDKEIFYKVAKDIDDGVYRYDVQYEYQNGNDILDAIRYANPGLRVEGMVNQDNPNQLDIQIHPPAAVEFADINLEIGGVLNITEPVVVHLPEFRRQVDDDLDHDFGILNDEAVEG